MTLMTATGAVPVKALTIRKADLGKLVFLAEGGFGQVFRVDGFLLPDDPAPLAYKEFTTARAEQARSATTAVVFRAELSDEDRADLDWCCAWPKALVEDPPGKVCGLLMSLIPAEFFYQRTDPDSGQPAAKPRALGWLAASSRQRDAAKVDIPEIDRVERLILLAHLVYAIGRLHRHGWVFGDVSASNAVFSLSPLRLMLIDCDGAAELSDRNRKQYSTPLWDPPECPNEPVPGQAGLQDTLDHETDVYKLGLAILRCLTPGKGAASARKPARIVDELDATGKALLARALGDDRKGRPVARDLYSYLRQLVLPMIAVPEVLAAWLATPVVVRGQDARVEWQIKGATHVSLSSGNGTGLSVDLARHPGGYVFRPDASGPVTLEASNRFGSVVAELGEIILYELPAFDLDLSKLPWPRVPALEPFTVGQLSQAAASRPQVSHAPALPPLPDLRTSGLVSNLSGAVPGLPTVPVPQLGAAVTDAGRAARALLATQTTSYIAALLRAERENT
jgi:hypothetical protein